MFNKAQGKTCAFFNLNNPMVKLGKKQLKVLDAIKAVDTTTIKDLSNTTGIDEGIVRNIVREFQQAEIIRVSVDNLITWRSTPLAEKNQAYVPKEKSEWEPYKPKLKNLSRIL